MVFNLEMFKEDYDFILLFKNDNINEAAFKFNNKNSKSDRFKDADKIDIGTIRIRNKYESHNVTGQKEDGLSIKVTFDNDNKMIPVPIDRSTGDIIRKSNDALVPINQKKINYIQNFIYANLDDIINYFETNDENELERYKNNILTNSVGKSFKKKVE